MGRKLKIVLWVLAVILVTFQGGKELAKFTSRDKGAAWSFDGIINPK
ncbi:hypothetical protein [Scopulibacillus cellulosilyticus]|uniref:Uncharacterized protein n=1 Tax=Scopulibacillus cellulosilyticus TaxID=2665665 RepID=A0ABW2Q044_9BACL